MSTNNSLTITRGEVAQVEREAAERKLLRAIQVRKRLEAMKQAIPSYRHTADFGTPERVEWHLLNYRDWIMSGEGPQSAYIYVAIGLSDGGTSKDLTEMVRPVDRRCAEETFRIINSLPEPQRMAILIDIGQLPNVFRFREPLEAHLERAKLAIGAALKARGIW